MQFDFIISETVTVNRKDIFFPFLASYHFNYCVAYQWHYLKSINVDEKTLSLHVPVSLTNSGL